MRDFADTVVQVHGAPNALVNEPGADARLAPRRRVLKAGIVATNERRLTVACAVRDVSSSGARLRAETSVGIPDTFDLIIATDGLEAPCQVVWRKANEVGVKFLSTPRVGAARRVQVITPVIPAQAASLRRKPKPNGSAV